VVNKSGSSVVWMLAGTAILGVSGYVFFAVIGHGRFDAPVAAALSATYLLSNVLGPGVFIATEQEASRVISDQRARVGIDLTTVRRLALVCALVGVLTLIVLGIVAPMLLANVLDGEIGFVLALALSVVGSAAVYYVRGLAGGQQRFHRYAASTGIDGGFRIVACVALAATGATNPIAYAGALCAGPGMAALLTARGVVPAADPVGTPASGPTVVTGVAVTTAPAGTPVKDLPEVADPSFGALGRGVAYLLVASFVGLAMANLAPVIVTGLLDIEPAAATGFAAAVVITRVPLLLMGPIQALLLPRLTSAAAAGRFADFRRDTRLGLATIGGLTVIAVAGVAVLGERGLRVLVGGTGAFSSPLVLMLLTFSAMLQMAVQFLQPALVAIRRHRMLVIAWLSGAVVFGLAFLVPIDPIDRGVLAQIAGPLVTMIIELATLGTGVGRSPGQR